MKIMQAGELRWKGTRGSMGSQKRSGRGGERVETVQGRSLPSPDSNDTRYKNKDRRRNKSEVCFGW